MKKLIVLFCLFSLPAFAEPQHLTILHFNDLHGHVEQAAKMATVIKEIRRENDKKGWYTLVFNGGDLISGTPVSFRYKGKAETDFLNITGIDASVIGNHDFDFGYDNLTKIITSSKGDMLAANIIGRNSKRSISESYTIKSPFPNLNILVFGLIMKDVPKIALPNDIKNVRFEDPVKTAEKIMRDEAGKTDIQIALTHEGVKNDINLAKNIEGLDLVIGGHDHVKPDEYCRDVGKTPVCQTPANGSYLGRIDLLVDRGTHRVKVPQPNGKTMGWVDIDVQNKDVDIKYLNNSLIRIDSTLKDDAAVAKLIRGYSDPIKAEMNEVVGYATHEYKHGRDTTLPGSPLGILIANVIKNYGDADIGIMNSTGMRSNLPEGKITKGLIGKMLPFPNTVVTVKIKGADLKKLIQKEATTPLNLAGISSPDELNPEKIYKLAVISYLAYGGSGCTRLKKAPVIKADDKVIWDIFADYIKKEKKI